MGLLIPKGGGAAGGGDMIADQENAEVSITGATTATISRWHIVTGSSAYTITLPAASGNGGKFIAFRFQPTSDAIVTLDGNSSETIGGELTAKYVAGESVVLLCDGSNWTIVSESLIQPHFHASMTGDQTGVATSTFTKITFANEEADSHGWYDNATNYRYTPKAPGVYAVFGQLRVNSLGDQDTCFVTLVKNNTIASGTAWNLMQQIIGAAGSPRICGGILVELNGSTDFIELFGWHDFGSNRTFHGSNTIDTWFMAKRVKRL